MRIQVGIALAWARPAARVSQSLVVDTLICSYVPSYSNFLRNPSSCRPEQMGVGLRVPIGPGRINVLESLGQGLEAHFPHAREVSAGGMGVT